MDELLSGLPNLLIPLIRSQLGLSYSQVSLLGLTLNHVSAPVEFISGLLIDLWKRPWLMAWGAAAIGIGTAGIALLILYPVWLLVPGLLSRFLLAIPINYLMTVYWPIARAQSLASVPGRGGTVTAVDSVFALVPLPLLFGLLAESITLTGAMLLVTMSSIMILLILTWFLSGSKAIGAKIKESSAFDD